MIDSPQKLLPAFNAGIMLCMHVYVCVVACASFAVNVWVYFVLQLPKEALFMGRPMLWNSVVSEQA